MFVIDASVLVKLFRTEEDSELARDGVCACLQRRVPLLSPGIVLYEVLTVALHYEIPFEIPITFLSDMRKAGFTIVEPNSEELLRAHRIASSRHEGRGHPGLEDSIYHAVAIERGGTFVTADRKHVEKTRAFGGVRLLSDWRPE